VAETERPARLTLTSDEVALVLRRAAEIDAATDDLADPTRYDAAAVEAAAGEVGLSPAAVRRAVAELRVGSLDDAGAPPAGERVRRGRVGRRDRGGRPSDVVADQRSVGRPPQAVLSSLDHLLRGQLFEPGRRTAERGVFRPRDDLAAKLRRRLDFTGTIKLDGVSCVTAVVTPAEDGALVRAEAELATTRAHVVAGSAGVGAGVGLLMGLGGALTQEVALVIAAVPAGTAIAAGGIRARSQRWHQKRAEIAETLATLLDRL
jgi:hypothetical protein